MDVRNAQGILDSLLLQLAQNRKASTTSGSTPRAATTLPQKKTEHQDVVSLTGKKADEESKKSGLPLPQNLNRLVSENTEKLENGFRRTQKFESGNDRKFIRVEEFVSTPDKARRIIIQQNNSGSTSVFENVLDRQKNGTFRQTQRFTDAAGEISTKITFDITPDNVDVIMGKVPEPATTNKKPFQPLRGTQFDISA